MRLNIGLYRIELSRNCSLEIKQLSKYRPIICSAKGAEMTNNKKVIKVKRVAGMNIKEIDFDVFEEMSEFERIQAIHDNPNLFLKKYNKMTALLLNGLEDGLKKAGPMDAVRSSNSSGNSDVTSEVAIRRACITTNNVEAIYEYGKNEQIDNIINLERALNLYSLILETYDDNISKVLRMRLEGKSYEQMEIELSYAITTLRQYVYMSKELLKEKYEYTISIFNARNSARRNIE